MKLVPTRRLRPSETAELDELGPHALHKPPEQLGYVRGFARAPLLLAALSGLSLFLWSPWLEFERPNAGVLTGFQMARHTLGWLWGGAIGWFLLLPLVLSRRSARQLRGIRAIAAAFSASTGLEVAMLLAFPPLQHPLYTVHYAFRWGLHASAALSLFAVALSLCLGLERRPPSVNRLEPEIPESRGPLH